MCGGEFGDGVPLGDLAGGEVVGAYAAAREIDREAVDAQPLVGLQPVVRAEADPGGDRAVRTRGLDPVAVHDRSGRRARRVARGWWRDRSEDLGGGAGTWVGGRVRECGRDHADGHGGHRREQHERARGRRVPPRRPPVRSSRPADCAKAHKSSWNPDGCAARYGQQALSADSMAARATAHQGASGTSRRTGRVGSMTAMIIGKGVSCAAPRPGRGADLTACHPRSAPGAVRACSCSVGRTDGRTEPWTTGQWTTEPWTTGPVSRCSSATWAARSGRAGGARHGRSPRGSTAPRRSPRQPRAVSSRRSSAVRRRRASGCRWARRVSPAARP